jgi:hypothetical protein
LAQALAELAYQVYRGKKPPTSVSKAFGAIVAMATKSGAVVAPKKRTRAAPRKTNGHDLGPNNIRPS